MIALRGFALLLVLAALTGCSPPPELAGRPVTPDDVSASFLLPPGRVERLQAAPAIDAAEVVTAGGARLRALRFAAAADRERAFAGLRDAMQARSDLKSRATVDSGPLQYMRYDGPSISGLTWVSGSWLFAAEAGNAAALAVLIGSSGAGGVGDPGLAGSPAMLATLFGFATLAIIAVLLLLLRLLVRSLAVRPAAGTAPVPRHKLMEQLLAMNEPGRPWVVRHGPEADLVVEWKYADAAWWGVLGKAGVKRAYRLRLYFDEAAHRCGALDEFGEIDWSAGLLSAPRVHFQQSFFRGIQLVKMERGVAYGFRTPVGGGAGKVLDYKFDIDEVKQPVIATVCDSGWTYQPILWPRRKSP